MLYKGATTWAHRLSVLVLTVFFFGLFVVMRVLDTIVDAALPDIEFVWWYLCAEPFARAGHAAGRICRSLRNDSELGG